MVTRGSREGRNRQSVENIEGRETTLYDTKMVDALSKATECITPRISLPINYGLWGMVCQCRFIDCTNVPLQ